MRRFRAKALTPVAARWPDALPAGGVARVDPSVRTAAELVAASAAPQAAVRGATNTAKNAA